MIEITKEIEAALKLCTDEKRADILRRAWDACCDGAALPTLGYDPWDGRHEKERAQVELMMVLCAALSDGPQGRGDD